MLGFALICRQRPGASPQTVRIVERPVRILSPSMPAWRDARLIGPTLLQARRSSVVALVCRPLGQRAGTGGTAELGILGLLECNQHVHRSGLPQLREFDRVINKAIRTSERNIWVFREHVCDQEPRVEVPLRPG